MLSFYYLIQRSPNRQFLFALGFFLLLAVYKFWSVLTGDGLCLTDKWDGIAAVGGIQTLVDVFYQNPGRIFSFQGFNPIEVGLGFGTTGWVNYLHLSLYLFVDLFTGTPDNTYDGVHFVLYVFNGLAFFYLLREMGCNWVFGLLGGLFLNHSDILVFRLDMHHYIGYPIFAILAILYSIRTARTLKTSDMILFAVVSVLNFPYFEYYGFFGAFVSIALFLAYFFYYQKISRLDWKSLLGKFLVSLSVFGFVFILLYPTIVLPKVVALFAVKTERIADTSFARDSFDFVAFSVRNFWYTFSPELTILQKILPAKHFKNDIWENTYRIGFLVPFLVLVYFLVQLSSRRDQLPKIPRSLVLFLLCLPAMLISVLFALSPNTYSLSWVYFTYQIAPMFRVGIRSLVYFDLILLAFFIIALQSFWQSFHSRALGKVLVGLFALVAFHDVSQIPLHAQLPAYELPDTSVYRKLREEPPGVVLELPFYSSDIEGELFTYGYLYHRSIHGHPMLNHPIPAGSRYNFAFAKFGSYLRDLDEVKIASLCASGIRYLAIHSTTPDVVHLAREKYEAEERRKKSMQNYSYAQRDWSDIVFKKTKYDLEHYPYANFVAPQNTELLFWQPGTAIYKILGECNSAGAKERIEELVRKMGKL